MEIPPGWELQARSRSGLAAKLQLHVLNSPGTIDSNYRGEIKIIVHRLKLVYDGYTLNAKDRERFTIKPGDRIAQLCFKPVYKAQYEITESLGDSERGTGGFGSSGT